MEPAYKVLNTVTQIGVVVRDLNRIEENYRRIFGIEPYRKVSGMHTNATFHGKTTDRVGCSCLFYNFCDLEIEYIQPLGEVGAWGEFLRQHGEGVHHIGFALNDHKELSVPMETAGVACIQSGDIYRGVGLSYKYYGLSELFGFDIEVNDDKPICYVEKRKNMDMRHKLAVMTERFPVTKLWCDSAFDSDIMYALQNGAIGVTTNPPIMFKLLSTELDAYRSAIHRIAAAQPELDAEGVTLELMKEICREKSKKLLHGNARFTLQGNPEYYKDVDKLIAQAKNLGSAMQNMQVKLPVSYAGVAAMEQCAYAGLSITATLAFSVGGILRSAEAIQRGLEARSAEGKSNDGLRFYIAMFQGRLDDYVRTCAKQQGLSIPDAYFDYAGIAITKKAYLILRDRGYQAKIMLGAFRKAVHWYELIGGDLSMTIARAQQAEYDAMDIDIISKIEEPVDEKIVNTLLVVPAFAQAYDETLEAKELDHFGGFQITLDAFAQKFRELTELVAGAMEKHDAGWERTAYE